jgi:hypothetical protein
VVEPDQDLHRLWNNGLHVITGRTVVYSMDVDATACPHSATAVEDLGDSVDEWHAGGAGTRACGGWDESWG